VAGRSDAELDALVEQAIVDAYDEYEQLASFHVVIEDHLAVPCQTTVLGVEVTVTKIDLLSGSGIVAICSRGKHRQAIGILDLPLPASPLLAPNGSTPTGTGPPDDGEYERVPVRRVPSRRPAVGRTGRLTAVRRTSVARRAREVAPG
jgi:hypothetical protein